MTNITPTERKLLSIQMAEKLFFALDNEMMRRADPMDIYALYQQQYESFARAYPMVLSKMVFYRKYSTKAFTRFLDGMEADPGKGMDGVSHHQAMYAKYLYQEDCKTNNKKYLPHDGKAVYEYEVNQMHKEVKRIKQDEKDATNEFEKENKKHVVELQDELLNFLENYTESSDDSIDTNALLFNDDDDDYMITIKKIAAGTYEEPEEEIKYEPEPVLTRTKEEVRNSYIDDNSATSKFFKAKAAKAAKAAAKKL